MVSDLTMLWIFLCKVVEVPIRAKAVVFVVFRIRVPFHEVIKKTI